MRIPTSLQNYKYTITLSTFPISTNLGMEKKYFLSDVEKLLSHLPKNILKDEKDFE
jgi:hypothetical protein